MHRPEGGNDPNVHVFAEVDPSTMVVVEHVCNPMLLNHKDKTPAATIRDVRTLLASLGVVAIERRWWEVEGKTFSVRLEAQGVWEGCAVNGKGASRELALASAYGEFMERLQNGYFTDMTFWVMPEHFAPPDAQFLAIAEVCRRWPGTAAQLFTKPAIALLGEQKVACVPFYDSHADDLAYLPLRFLRMAYSSTGMTGGNSASEALVQGLCEINERHVINQVSRSALVLPTIPLEQVPDGYSRRLISRLRDWGYAVHVKDATLGGRYPVLASLVIAPERGYHIHFGSDPVFEIALQRSLTEFCQGQSDVAQRLKPFPWEAKGTSYSKSIESWAQFLDRPGPARELRRLAYTKDGSGGLGENVLLDRAFDRSCFAAFVSEARSNEEMFSHLVRQCEANGGRVLTRDVSFLGFPAFQVHVPRWAEDCIIDQALAEADLKTPELTRIASSLDRASLRELRHFTSTLREFMTQPALVQGPVSRLCPLGVNEDGEASDVLTDPDVLLFLLHLRLKDWGLAFHHVERHVQRLADGGDEEGLEYFRCVAAYLHMRASGMTLRACRGTLRSLFGESLACEVIDDIDPAKNPFRHHKLMTCGNCESCTCRGICGYESWKARWELLLARMEAAGIDQLRLREVFPGRSHRGEDYNPPRTSHRR